MSARTTLRLGTRGSALALAQAQLVADALAPVAARPVELVRITTHGDATQSAGTDLETIGGTGVFATELRRAVLEGEVDLAVHSYKDLPTAAYDGLSIGAVPPRADPRDVLVARDGLTLGELEPGSTVGTGSPRRVAQLRALDLGLDLQPIRGNVDTRLRAVAEGRYDAVVLARAGLLRLGRAEEATEVLDPIQVLPAPAQGALAVECRSGDQELLAWLQVLDDADSHLAVRAERAVLTALEAGCSAPIGALAEVVEGEDGPELSLRAVVAAPDGSDALRRSMTGSVADPDGLGARLAAVLLEDGAADLAPGLAVGVVPGLREPVDQGTAGTVQALDQMSHPSVAPRTQGHESGTVPTNPSSTTTERVS
jgi:hydroxymethylbilane synthase